MVLARALDQIVGAAMQIQATSKKNKKQKTMPTIHNRYEFIKQAPKINCFPLQDCRSDPAEDQSRMRADVNLLHKTLTSKWNPEPISFQQSVTTPSTYHVTRHFSWKDTSVCVSVLLFVFFLLPPPSMSLRLCPQKMQGLRVTVLSPMLSPDSGTLPADLWRPHGTWH